MTEQSFEPAVIDFLAKVVRRHCEAHGIETPEGKDSVAASALTFYSLGFTTEKELLDRLEAEDNPNVIRFDRPH